MMSTAGKPISCRAAVIWAPQESMVIEQITVDPPKEREIRVKIIACGVCRSDYAAWLGTSNIAQFPCILGHEASGIVESVGAGVTSFDVGDHVIPLFNPHCRQCSGCLSPKSNICFENNLSKNMGLMLDGTSRYTCKGQKLFTFIRLGCFSEYVVIQEIAAAKINPQAPLEKVALIGCCIPTGYGSAVNVAKVEAGSTCAVWGLGGVGLSVGMGCRNRGAAKIIGIDINPEKFEIAKKFGFTEFINPNDCSDRKVEEILQQLNNGGVDYTFECIGKAETIKAAFRSAHRSWGLSVIIGLASADTQINFSPAELLQGRKWTGTFFGGFKGRDSVPKLVDDYMRGDIMVEELISGELPIEKINEAFELLAQGIVIFKILSTFIIKL